MYILKAVWLNMNTVRVSSKGSETGAVVLRVEPIAVRQFLIIFVHGR